ncbi:MAG: hypothetical protein ACKO7B_01820 [Flavobacteriales bacterium]
MKEKIQRIAVMFLGLAAVALTGCGDPKLNYAGEFAAGLIQSQEFNVDVSQESGAKVYELKVKNAQWDTHFSNDDILSTCALAFYNQLPKTEQPEYVRLVVEKDANMLRRTFSNEELQLADRCIDKVTDFFEWHPRMGIDSLRPLVDPQFFPDSLIVKMSESILTQDSLDNSFTRADFIGFDSDTLANIPVLTIKMMALRNQSRQRYDAFVGMKSERVLLVVPADM